MEYGTIPAPEEIADGGIPEDVITHVESDGSMIFLTQGFDVVAFPIGELGRMRWLLDQAEEGASS